MMPRCARRVTLAILSVLFTGAPARAQERPKILLPLYGVHIGLQVADAVTTLVAIQAGGVEQNRVPSALIARHPYKFLALKAGMATAAITTSELLVKHDKPKEAIFVMLGANATMGYVFGNNLQVIATLKW